jgi:hypothetical protein
MQFMTPEQVAERYQGRRRPGGNDPLAAAGRRSAVKPHQATNQLNAAGDRARWLRASFRDGKTARVTDERQARNILDCAPA